jgi:hypothetical protein
MPVDPACRSGKQAIPVDDPAYYEDLVGHLSKIRFLNYLPLVLSYT